MRSQQGCEKAREGGVRWGSAGLGGCGRHWPGARMIGIAVVVIAGAGEGCDSGGDTAYVPAPGATCNGTHCGEICTDGIDNDGDGWIDCGDSECTLTTACYNYTLPLSPSYGGTGSAAAIGGFGGTGGGGIWVPNGGSGAGAESEPAGGSGAAFWGTAGSAGSVVGSAGAGGDPGWRAAGAGGVARGGSGEGGEAGLPARESSCSDGVNDDGDEWTDCLDPDCKLAPECLAMPPGGSGG